MEVIGWVLCAAFMAIGTLALIRAMDQRHAVLASEITTWSDGSVVRPVIPEGERMGGIMEQAAISMEIAKAEQTGQAGVHRGIRFGRTSTGWWIKWPVGVDVWTQREAHCATKGRLARLLMEG